MQGQSLLTRLHLREAYLPPNQEPNQLFACAASLVTSLSNLLTAALKSLLVSRVNSSPRTLASSHFFFASTLKELYLAWASALYSCALFCASRLTSWALFCACWLYALRSASAFFASELARLACCGSVRVHLEV